MNPQPQTNGRARPAPAQTQNVPAKREAPKSIEALLSNEGMLAQIQKALPKHMTHDRMARIALTECRKNPELAACDVMSFAGAIIQCAQLGLEPGSGLGHAYLIPFNNRARGIKEVQFIPGYRGLVDLARRSGMITSLEAFAIHKGDIFERGFDLTRGGSFLRWIPGDGEQTADNLTHVFAVANFKGGGYQPVVMTRAEVEKIRDMGNGNPVWKKHFVEMAKKTAVRRLCKLLPQSPEMHDLVDAIEAEDLVDADVGQANWSAIDADYEPVAPEHGPAKINAIRDAEDAPRAPATDAAREAAIKTLDSECARVTKLGGDPFDICKRKSRDEILGMEAGFIRAYAATMANWKPATKASPLRPEPTRTAVDDGIPLPDHE